MYAMLYWRWGGYCTLCYMGDGAGTVRYVIWEIGVGSVRYVM